MQTQNKKRNMWKIGDLRTILLYGNPTKCRLLDIKAFGTIDIERLVDGKCFRLSGLGFTKAH